MDKFISKLIKTLIVIIVVLFFVPFNNAYAETLDEYFNNLVAPKQQYNTMLSPAYIRNNESDEYINLQNGQLTLSQTDYVIPGRNGLDLKLERIYNGGQTNVWEMKYGYRYNGYSWAWCDYGWADENTTTFYEDRFNLGAGYRLSFPQIEIRQNSDGSSYKYLHSESGDIYRMLDPVIDGSTYRYPLENHTVKDIEITEDNRPEDNRYKNGQINGISKYVMTDKNGKKTYFDRDGKILGVVDRYGNTINFEYSTLKYKLLTNSIPQTTIVKQKELITKITDSVGRVVNIEYIEGVKNSDGIYESKLDGGGEFKVIIYLPDDTPSDLTDNKKITYIKSAMLGDTTNVVRTRFQGVVDVDGQIKYWYWYDQTQIGFTFVNETSYSATILQENINQIDYKKSNKLIRYVYNTSVKSLSNSGSMQYRKVVEIQDLAKTGFDDSKPDYLDKFICDIKNKTTFLYTNEPDGYSYAGYNANDDNYLKNTYRYYSEVTDMRGAKTKYTYNGLGEAINVESYGNDHKIVSTTTYDSNKLPRRNESLEYKVVNGQVTGAPVKKVEEYIYDNYGNLTQYSGPAYRDANGNLTGSTFTTPEGTTVNEHTVVYSYAIDKYHVLTTKTWKKDAATTSRIEYLVDAKGNIISEKNKYIENGTDKYVVTDYLYDSFGNMTQSKCYYLDYSENPYIINYEYGVDADEVDHNGAYLTKQYSNVDGVEISTKYAYDHYTGNKKADIDPNGNRISYSYDMLERLSQILYPDNTTKSYYYNDFYYEDREILFVDQAGNSFIYKYDIFGNLSKYRCFLDSWKEVSYQYDSNGNKTKEIDALGHCTRYEYDSNNRPIKKSFWENDTTQKKSMSLSYDFGYDNNIPLVVSVINEEGYTTKNYYDILNRLVRTDSTPDKVNYYSTVFSYDYAGNNTSIKDARNYTTNYIFDDLNRLIKKTDALLNNTLYAYDAAGNLIKETNARNISCFYEYDGLGRLVREKAPAADGTLAITRYIYDKNGNKTKVIAPSYYDVAKDTPELAVTMTGVAYTYDTMNRLIGTLSPEGIILEYRKYDSNGNIKKIADGLRYTGNIDTSLGTTYYYDRLNRVVRITNTAGGNSYLEYDAVGNLVKKTDPKGYITTHLYNADRTLAKTTYPDTGYVEYTYDKLGNMLTSTDQLGNLHTYSYNGFNKVLTVKDPYDYIIENQYDQVGNLKSIIDKLGSISYYEYDANNRITQKKVPLENVGGNIIYSIENYEYDAVGNIIKQTTTGTKDATSSRITNYSYYNNNLLSSVTDNVGRNETYYYDKNGNKTKTVTLRSSGVYDISRYEYDNRNRIIKSINLVDETSIYNAATLPNIAVLRDSEYTGKIQLITGYEYDLIGNKTKVFDPRAYGFLASDSVNREKYAIRYTYDVLNRLEKVYRKYNGTDIYTQSYYDANSNIIQYRNERGYYTYYTYDSMNRLKTERDYLNNITTNNYDLAGNKLSVINALYNTITYTYDKLNRLETVKYPDNIIITKNIYDSNGNVIKTIDAKGYLSGTTDNTRYGTEYSYDMANRLVTVISI